MEHDIVGEMKRKIMEIAKFVFYVLGIVALCAILFLIGLEILEIVQLNM